MYYSYFNPTETQQKLIGIWFKQNIYEAQDQNTFKILLFTNQSQYVNTQIGFLPELKGFLSSYKVIDSNKNRGMIFRTTDYYDQLLIASRSEDVDIYEIVTSAVFTINAQIQNMGTAVNFVRDKFMNRTNLMNQLFLSPSFELGENSLYNIRMLQVKKIIYEFDDICYVGLSCRVTELNFRLNDSCSDHNQGTRFYLKFTTQQLTENSYELDTFLPELTDTTTSILQYKIQLNNLNLNHWGKHIIKGTYGIQDSKSFLWPLETYSKQIQIRYCLDDYYFDKDRSENYIATQYYLLDSQELIIQVPTPYLEPKQECYKDFNYQSIISPQPQVDFIRTQDNLKFLISTNDIKAKGVYQITGVEKYLTELLQSVNQW
ncbi:UNKNOWN [Stylonychia lemnae]|uniref:Uncharacterized protein n=1 Tax=Stylonychia lemnae TaxID=5949 RepID=A0A078B2E9_STYLE|nr:UNKNOWN [Stylonychia lemnae]|eukprot:CDW87392.1 UNKNOWN [Stylonychia lemnae]